MNFVKINSIEKRTGSGYNSLRKYGLMKLVRNRQYHSLLIWRVIEFV